MAAIGNCARLAWDMILLKMLPAKWPIKGLKA